MRCDHDRSAASSFSAATRLACTAMSPPSRLTPLPRIHKVHTQVSRGESQPATPAAGPTPPWAAVFPALPPKCGRVLFATGDCMNVDTWAQWRHDVVAVIRDDFSEVLNDVRDGDIDWDAW